MDNNPNRDRKRVVFSSNQPPRPDRSLTVAVLITLFLPAVSCFAEAITLHVSPENTPNTLPSLTAARDSIREHRAKGEWKDQPITVQIRGGRYFLSEPFALMSEDSGVTYAAEKNEQPIFSGG